MAKKEAYREKAEARLERLDARIDLVKARAKEAKADAQIEIEQRLEDLRGKRQTVRSRLDELGRQGEEAWQAFKSGVDDALDELTDAVDRAFSKLEM